MTTSTQALDVRIEDQITQYINAALLRGVKFEVNAIGDWCREITCLEFNERANQWMQKLWVSVYISDAGRLKVEAQWIGREGGRVNKSDIIDHIGYVQTRY